MDPLLYNTFTWSTPGSPFYTITLSGVPLDPPPIQSLHLEYPWIPLLYNSFTWSTPGSPSYTIPLPGVPLDSLLYNSFTWSTPVSPSYSIPLPGVPLDPLLYNPFTWSSPGSPSYTIPLPGVPLDPPRHTGTLESSWNFRMYWTRHLVFYPGLVWTKIHSCEWNVQILSNVGASIILSDKKWWHTYNYYLSLL